MSVATSIERPQRAGADGHSRTQRVPGLCHILERLTPRAPM